ncbi:14304_t:CDS:2 [Entrophospora sp. SA101]|nr:14304_t:CDS:2 [Entrophospora sp. SA101]
MNLFELVLDSNFQNVQYEEKNSQTIMPLYAIACSFSLQELNSNFIILMQQTSISMINYQPPPVPNRSIYSSPHRRQSI